MLDGVTVHRFSVEQRDKDAFTRVSRKLAQGMRLTLSEERTYTREMLSSPQLLDYLKAAEAEYDLYVFLPYAFGTTFYGMQLFPDKSVLIPCFYDEPSAYLRIFRQTYIQARGMIYHSVPEMEFAGRLYDFSGTEQICIGIGMKTDIQGDPDGFRKAYHIDDPFLLYAGRKTAEKNVPLLLKYFTEYKRRMQDALKLVLIGSGRTEIAEEIRSEVYDLGYVTEQDKYNAMAAAVLLCQPSRKESFSRAMMESWLCGRPVLVHADCPVTREFVRSASGGLYFRNYLEFEGCVNYIRAHREQASQMGESGREFVQNGFDWETTIQAYEMFFENLST